MKSTPAERCLARSADQIELWVDREGDLRLQHPHPNISGSFLIQPLAGRNLGRFLTGFTLAKDTVFQLSRLEHPQLPALLTSAMWVISYYEHPLVGFSIEPVTMEQAVDVLTRIPDLPVICVGDTLCTLPATLRRAESAGLN